MAICLLANQIEIIIKNCLYKKGKGTLIVQNTQKLHTQEQKNNKQQTTKNNKNLK